MNQGETVQAFFTRVSALVNQIKSCGEDLAEKVVVMKVLRSLTTNFDHVVAAIEESKDLSTYTFDELMGSLQTHEVRLLKSDEKGDSKAFLTRGDSRSCGTGSEDSQHQQQTAKKNVECYYCQKFGHIKADCRKKKRDDEQRRKGVECYYCHKTGHVQAYCYKKKREEEQAAYAEENAEEIRLFLAKTEGESDVSHLWFLDSGCSN